MLAVKGNQEKLFKAIKSELKSTDGKMVKSKTETKHGWVEVREYRVLPAPKSKPFCDWPSIRCIGEAMSFRYDKSGMEYRYYISSRALSAQDFAIGVREYWGIENSLHWVLGTAFSEDACQIYRDNAA
ncbi:hypothetical protein VHA01S_074_00080 [Vibrio halioticoli NBRC 102217]|uniref:Transposase IS4-like domain-containing protein n=1 Tax=Vibrio halioticoli NBRC 102217 TaxID=1219072 RepID=V5FRD0_9VIBR|nr:hypothetical protein VHA01S_074_00080 [Vibrio halioticoli NBRC 102217]